MWMEFAKEKGPIKKVLAIVVVSPVTGRQATGFGVVIVVRYCPLPIALHIAGVTPLNADLFW